MKASALVRWWLLAGSASAWPGVRRRQVQSSSGDCTCPANGPVTTTVTQSSFVTSTITSSGSTITNTGPAVTSTVMVSSTSTATVFTDTTTVTDEQTVTEGVASSTTTITTTATITICTASTALRLVKKQNTNSASPTTTTATDSTLLFTSTYSSRVVTCTCRARPQTTVFPTTSSCSCPATTATTVTVTSVSSGTVFVTVQESPTIIVITPTSSATTTVTTVITSSELDTVEVTETVTTTLPVATFVTTVTQTVVSCSSTPGTSTRSSTTSTTAQLGPTTSAAGSFQCNSTAYLVSTDANGVVSLYNINLDTGATITFATNVGAGTYTTLNGMGFNIRDNFLYAIATVSPSTYALVRVLVNGSLQEILRFPAQTTNTTPGNIGDFDLNGQMYISGAGTTWAKIDLLPGSSTYGTIVAKGNSTLTGYTVLDWSYLGGQPGYMYSIGRTTASNPTYSLLRWSLTDHTWSVYQTYPNNAASNTIIASWGGAQNTIWGFSATTGRISRIVLGGQITTLGTGPTNINGGDGARCALAAE